MEGEEIRSAMRNILNNQGLMPWPFNEEAVRECFRTWEAWQEAKPQAIAMTRYYNNDRSQDYYEKGRRDAANIILNTMSRLEPPAPKLTEREALLQLLNILIAMHMVDDPNEASVMARIEKALKQGSGD